MMLWWLGAGKSGRTNGFGETRSTASTASRRTAGPDHDGGTSGPCSAPTRAYAAQRGPLPVQRCVAAPRPRPSTARPSRPRARNECWAEWRLSGQVIGVGYRSRYVFRSRRFIAPFDVWLRKDGRIRRAEKRLAGHQGTHLLTGQYHHRGLIPICREHMSESVTEATGRVRVHQNRPVTGPREAVGHRHHRGFPQAKDVPQIRGPVPQEGNFRSSGIPENGGEPETSPQFPGDLAHSDFGHRDEDPFDLVTALTTGPLYGV
jgi:hypothetical protein